MSKRYLYRGHEIFVGVSPNIRIEGGVFYCTLWRSPLDGQMHKLTLSALPDRKTRAGAQKDLDKWADLKKLKEA
ncbi:MAG: hypothetical protein LUC51_11595 [Cloacibacillus porcorum]|uniref:hypothetical protein n=1 Tax=Cloacibacillus porcorum TaxID=1197717 RepID=UPI002671EC10|nr:hypothetical protein [Cloacibacillus porcorum]MCD8235007.1 hypothetical protein [Cloacibacillus porcorum]